MTTPIPRHPGMFSYIYEHRVRYRECDPMGLVYHAHYVDYFEAARTEALRNAGLPYRKIEESGIIMPVVDLAIHYIRPARYDDLLQVRCIIHEPPRVRLKIEYEVRRAGDPALLTTGTVTLCFVDQQRNRPIAAPEEITRVVDRAIRKTPELHQA